MEEEEGEEVEAQKEEDEGQVQVVEKIGHFCDDHSLKICLN